MGVEREESILLNLAQIGAPKVRAQAIKIYVIAKNKKPWAIRLQT